MNKSEQTGSVLIHVIRVLLTPPDFRRTLAASLKSGFTMSYLERAITKGYARLTGHPEQWHPACQQRGAHRHDQEVPSDTLGGPAHEESGIATHRQRPYE